MPTVMPRTTCGDPYPGDNHYTTRCEREPGHPGTLHTSGELGWDRGELPTWYVAYRLPDGQVGELRFDSLTQAQAWIGDENLHEGRTPIGQPQTMSVTDPLNTYRRPGR